MGGQGYDGGSDFTGGGARKLMQTQEGDDLERLTSPSEGLSGQSCSTPVGSLVPITKGITAEESLKFRWELSNRTLEGVFQAESHSSATWDLGFAPFRPSV